MRLRRKVLAWTALGLSAVVGLGLFLGWLLRRQDRLRLVPRSDRVPPRLAAVAERERAVFGIGWIHDPAVLLDVATRTAGLRLEPPALGWVLGYLASDAVLFGLQEPRLDRGWTTVAFLRASPAMTRALPWVRRYLPPTWQWRDRPAVSGCSDAFELSDPAARPPWHLEGQFCGGYLIVGEAESTLSEQVWQALQTTAVGDTLLSVPEGSRPDFPPPAAVAWLRPDRLPEAFRRMLPKEVQTWVEAQVPAGQWVTLAVGGETERLEIRVVFPMAP